MNKILFLSNTANFSKFNRPYMRWFREQGWQVDYCSAGEENAEFAKRFSKENFYRNFINVIEVEA